MDVQLTAVLTERSDADAQKDQNTECQDNCRGEKRQQGCDGEDPRLFPSETGEKSNIDDVRLLWNAPRIYQPRSSGAAGKKGDLGNHGVQHEAAQQEIRGEPAGLSCPGSIFVDSPHIGLYLDHQAAHGRRPSD